MVDTLAQDVGEPWTALLNNKQMVWTLMSKLSEDLQQDVSRLYSLTLVQAISRPFKTTRPFLKTNMNSKCRHEIIRTFHNELKKINFTHTS